MAFYKDHIYSHLVSALGDPKPIQKIRRRMIPLAQGDVLEIGVGPGVNFVHYDPAKVTKLYALEPNPGMIRMAEHSHPAHRSTSPRLLKNVPSEFFKVFVQHGANLFARQVHS